MENDIAIKVENVSKVFTLPQEKVTSVKGAFTGIFQHKKKPIGQQALKDINLEIKKGEFFGIVGRNGSGKSTLLKILAGIYQPTKGEVHTFGKLVPFIELGVGFNPELTGRENVFLNGAMLGFSRKEVEVMYKEIVAFAELDKFMEQKLKNYSSGMQVRLAFAMAIRSQADILLVDEVLAVGDADFQRKCFNYFKSLKKNKKTVVFVSHDMSAIREYCDKALLINENRAVILDDADKVSTAYTKLFSKNEELQINDKNTTSKRWGTGIIKTTSVSTEVKDDKILISQIIQAFKNLEDPILGIRLRDATGSDVLGTNNKIEGCKTGPIETNEKRKITWEMPNVLSDGEYVIDLSIHYADGVTVADWWDDAKKFRLVKDRKIPYAIDPGFKIVVSRQ